MDMLVSRSDSDSLRGLLIVFAAVALVVVLRAMTIGVDRDATNTEPIHDPSPSYFVGE